MCADDGGTVPNAPQLWVFAGPNGAGKSTLVARQVRGRVPVVNPDDIARTRPPALDGGVDVLTAGRVAVELRERYLRARESFAIETTLTGRGELSLIARANDAGYAISLYYVGLDDLALSVRRVATRVASGGHDVPRADLFRRFDRSRSNLAEALRLADRAFVLDNSGQRRRLVLVRSGGRARIVSRRVPPWVEAAVPADLRAPAP